MCVIGRFVEQKGIEYAIRAFAPHASEDVRLDIIGDGPMADDFHALVDRLGIRRVVSFLGVLRPDQVSAHLRTCDVLLAPSVVTRIGERESGLIVVKEAGACGLPVVGSVHGGIPEIIDEGVTGFLVQERDVGGLSDRLGSLLADEALRERMGAAARAFQSWKISTTKRSSVFTELHSGDDGARGRYRRRTPASTARAPSDRKERAKRHVAHHPKLRCAGDEVPGLLSKLPDGGRMLGLKRVSPVAFG